MSKVAEIAPNFTLRSTSNDDVSLVDFRGKTVILAFFPAAFTGVCQNFAMRVENLSTGLSVDGNSLLTIAHIAPARAAKPCRKGFLWTETIPSSKVTSYSPQPRRMT